MNDHTANWNKVLVLGLTELPNELPNFLSFDFGLMDVNDDDVELKKHQSVLVYSVASLNSLRTLSTLENTFLMSLRSRSSWRRACT